MPRYVWGHGICCDRDTQTHSACDVQADAMVISWITNSTHADASPSTVRYGTVSNAYTHVALGNFSTYAFGTYSSGRIHHVVLLGLTPSTTYYYHVGKPDTAGQSSFTSNPGPKAFPFSLALLGDVGLSSNGTLPWAPGRAEQCVTLHRER